MAQVKLLQLKVIYVLPVMEWFNSGDERMLKPSDTWSWYYDEQQCSLMPKNPRRGYDFQNESGPTMVDCAFRDNEFTADDASLIPTFKEQISGLELPEPRQAELALNAHKEAFPQARTTKELVLHLTK
ncbi:cell division protein ZapC [Vibrio chagasii]|nr:cell division protein ZapC [Vibrio chagasii]